MVKLNDFIHEPGGCNHEIVQSNHENVQSNHEVVQSNHEVVQSNHEINQFNHEMTQSNHEVIQSNHEVVQSNHEIIQFNHEMTQSNHEVIQSNHEVIQSNHEVVQSNHEINQFNHEMTQSNHEMTQSNHEIVQFILALNNFTHEPLIARSHLLIYCLLPIGIIFAPKNNQRMPPVQNILFDLGGVLLNLDVQLTRNEFIDLGVTQIDDLFRIGHASSFFKQYEMGTITDAEFVEKAQQLANPGTTKQQIIEAWNRMLLDFPAERVDFLNRLKNKYRLFLFSNTNAIHLEYFQKNYQTVYGNPLDHHFEKAYYSHVINRRKPDVTAFQYVIEDSKIDAATTLFIDDALVNVQGAREAGLQAVHLSEGKTILDLELI